MIISMVTNVNVINVIGGGPPQLGYNERGTGIR